MLGNQRKYVLVRPRLQLRLALTFCGLLAVALMLQYILGVRAWMVLSGGSPDATLMPVAELTLQLTRSLLISMGLVMPLTLLAGVLVTHRIAGPVHRFEVYLKAVLAGEEQLDCRLRKGDELVELCSLINEVTEKLRAQNIGQSTERETTSTRTPKAVA